MCDDAFTLTVCSCMCVNCFRLSLLVYYMLSLRRPLHRRKKRSVAFLLLVHH